MRIKYPQTIGEIEAELAQLEHQLRGTKQAVRVQMLRLLKSGQAASLGAVAPLVGYSQVQCTRWWEEYRREGLHALVQPPEYPGRPSQLTAEARADLHAAMERGEIATLEAARQYLDTHWQIAYASGKGVWKQLRRERTHQKTGRLRHRKASAAKQAALKKTSRRRSPAVNGSSRSTRAGSGGKRGVVGGGVRQASIRRGSWRISTSGSGCMWL